MSRVMKSSVIIGSPSIGCGRKWVIIGCVAGVTVVAIGYGIVKFNRRVASWLCSRTKTNINVDFRKRFNQDFVFNASPPRDASHSHPESSRLRTDGERSIDNLIYTLGFEPFSVSTSARDVEGQRLLYSAKDLDLPYQNTAVTTRHVLRMIDVDYYADMEYWLRYGRPILLYSFVPEVTGGDIVEGVFSIDGNTATVIHNGGGRYIHKFWDYNVDHFIVSGWFKNLMVKVDQVRVPGDSNRRIICLTPTTWYYKTFGWLFPNAQRLEHRKFTYGDANICTFIKTENNRTKNMVSMSLRDTPTNVSMEYACFVGICKRLAQSKHPNVSDVERYLHKDGVENAAYIAPIIYEAFEGGWYKSLDYRAVDQVVSCGPARGAPHFQALTPLVTEVGDEIGTEVFRPILTGAAIFPRASLNNDTAAVQGRVERIRNTVNPASKYYMYMREFIGALKPDMHKCVPVSMSDVIERQDRPLQKLRCERNKMWCRCQKFHVKSFMKKESYSKVNDPRNISTCTPSHTMTLSTYTYAAKEVFKKFNWFVPGRTPKEIADMIMLLVANHHQVLSCDYSRLDGTISAFLRSLERGVYLRLFPERLHNDLAKLLDDEVKSSAVTATGYRYDPGSSRLSGSPLTTDGNTVIVGFVAYCAGRDAGLLKEGEVEMIPALVYGDDKLVVGITKDRMERTARALGLTLKCEVAQAHEPVEFLARIFVNPWLTTTSIQNPVRSLGKVHLSHIRNVDKEIVAHNKARGYLVTDRLTPLMREYCLNVLAQTDHVTELHLNRQELLSDTPYWSLYENESWPQAVEDVEAMEKIVADQLHVSIAEIRGKCAQVLRNNWEPFQHALPVAMEAVVDGIAASPEIVVPDRPASEPGTSRRRPGAARV